VCGHSDKPLYAKGFWKQWYLSKYKQKVNWKPDFRPEAGHENHLDANPVVWPVTSRMRFESNGDDSMCYFENEQDFARL
jgi:hypothetical protein